jgi:sugar phosphate isomerase/epimerase
MNISRRTFIKTNSIAMAGVAMLPGFMLDKRKSHEIVTGIQLYTVRDDMKKDPAGTLKRLREMGYKYVEHAGFEDRKFYGYEIPVFKKLLSDTGLKMPSGHSFLGAKAWDKQANDFTNEWKNTIEDAAAVGMEYIISPGVDESLCKNMDDFKWYMDLFNKHGNLCKKMGVTFAYHNENYEFDHRINGHVIYDLLLESTDPSIVDQQIDIGNMYEPGGRAMYYLKKYPGRFLLMHVKDEIKKPKPSPEGQVYESALLGKGIIDVKNIIDYARKSGTKYFIIEQESYQDKTPLQCADEDLKAMKKWGF